jgi:hypothetical protein
MHDDRLSRLTQSNRRDGLQGQTQGLNSWSFGEFPSSKTTRLKSLLLLPGSQGSVRCGGKWLTVHELPAGPSRVCGYGKQEEKVRFFSQIRANLSELTHFAGSLELRQTIRTISCLSRRLKSSMMDFSGALGRLMGFPM